MDFSLIEEMIYSYASQYCPNQMPQVLKDTLHLTSAFFKNDINNKLCIVFPSKEFAAQWLTVPLVLHQIYNDYEQYKSEIIESCKIFVPGEKLILNNSAVVEWVGIINKEINGHFFEGPTFRTKAFKQSSGVDITIGYDDGIKLQQINASKILSSLKKVKEALPERNITPTEKLLHIDTFGNKNFIKNSICLISKFKCYDDSIVNVLLNQFGINDYFKPGKIDENGKTSESSPLIISNNFSNLFLNLCESKPVSKIIIDGFSAITPRNDFSDIDREHNIHTVLITDLSEIDSFEEIKNYGFEFFNFTKENITNKENCHGSSFASFERKLNKYIVFKLYREVCNNAELESISKNLHSLSRADLDENLNILKVSLIQNLNLLSRICYFPNETEIAQHKQKISSIESHFLKCALWLGEAKQPIENAILLLKKFVQQLSDQKNEKCITLEKLLQHHYDYIICPTEEEANTLRKYIAESGIKVISVSDVNNKLLSEYNKKAILTGWPKWRNFNRISSSFIFSELTVLFYQFENRYYASLQKHNREHNENIKSTITIDGIKSINEYSVSKGYEDLYPVDKDVEITNENVFDVVEFELKLDDTQYLKYFGKGNIAESCKARRVNFENNTFIYATESHKFLVINELIDTAKLNPNIQRMNFESLQPGDVIAFINTDRDVLVYLVETITNPADLAEVTKWTDLWQLSLREHFEKLNNFDELVQELRDAGCKRHPATIRAWLQDDDRIGPDDDEDVISIGKTTNSPILVQNIQHIRKAISQMKGLRMRASELVREKIKTKLLEIKENLTIGLPVHIPNLGNVEILKVNELKKQSEEIDKKFINHLIAKEII